MVSFSSLTSASSLAVTEAMYANTLLEALHTSCDQARRAGDGRTIIGASLSEPHIDGTTGRFHICIIITSFLLRGEKQ